MPDLETVIAPDASFYAIGDIHGCLDQLNTLLAKIDPNQDQQLIFLGDYVDRGPATAQVLAQLYELDREAGDRVVCLRGNHEKMMLEFIDDPLGRGRRWLVNGGVDTMRSYGISGLSNRPEPDDAMDACEALEAAMPDGMIAWLRTLPTQWNSGNVWCVHAAMDPETPPDEQRSGTLLWGHGAFLNTPRQDGLCVIHGHTIVDQPSVRNTRIAVDTGAYRSGRLTAAHIQPGICTFVST